MDRTEPVTTFPDPEITGALLAGGRSRRMGSDKATLPWGGGTFASHLVATLRQVAGRVIVAGDRPDLAGPELPAFADRRPGSALGGLETALQHAATPWVLAVACDLPRLEAGLLRHLVSARGGAEAVVPLTAGGAEPLCALYRRDCLPRVRERLARGELRLSGLLEDLLVRYLRDTDWPPAWRQGLANINTPAELARQRRGPGPVPAVAFVAPSGTGKTTLLEKLIAEFRRRGLRVGALKHDAHRFDIDHPGKDSWRLTRAGADRMLLSGAEQSALVVRHPGREPDLEELLGYFTDVDLVLAEGYRKSALPRIEVSRAARGTDLLCRGAVHDPKLVAVAADHPLQLDVPVFDLEAVGALCDFIQHRLLERGGSS